VDPKDLMKSCEEWRVEYQNIPPRIINHLKEDRVFLIYRSNVFLGWVIAFESGFSKFIVDARVITGNKWKEHLLDILDILHH
jgi:hypothetical protein